MIAAAALASCGVDDVYYGEMYDPSSLMDAPYQPLSTTLWIRTEALSS